MVCIENRRTAIVSTVLPHHDRRSEGDASLSPSLLSLVAHSAAPTAADWRNSGKEGDRSGGAAVQLWLPCLSVGKRTWLKHSGLLILWQLKLPPKIIVHPQWNSFKKGKMYYSLSSYFNQYCITATLTPLSTRNDSFKDGVSVLGPNHDTEQRKLFSKYHTAAALMHGDIVQARRHVSQN